MAVGYFSKLSNFSSEVLESTQAIGVFVHPPNAGFLR